jgi:hypothetical protein
VLSDEGKLGTPAVLAFLTHLAVVPRQDEGRMGRQRPARKRLAEVDAHLDLVTQRQRKALGEDETSQWCRALELVLVNLYQRRVREDSPLEGAVTPMHKR